MDVFRREMVGYAGTPNQSLMAGSRQLGFGTRRTLIGNPNAVEEELAKKPGALKTAIEKLDRLRLLSRPAPSTDSLPSEVQQAAALVLEVALRVRDYRRLAFKPLGELAPLYASAKLTTDDSQPETIDDRLRIFRQTNLSYLGAGAHDLLLATQTAQGLIEKVPPDRKFDVRIDTAWGVIRLCGGGNDTHGGDEFMLILDTGGDDTYINAPSNAGPNNWVSIVVDQAGNDKYLSDPALATRAISEWDGRKSGRNEPGPGAALLGYCFLIDSAGDDLYRTHRPGIGSAFLGFAAVLDRAGNDRYDAYQNAQGFGQFGVGILEDLAGDDRYEGFFQVQGCGQTAGFGLLADRAGDDVYLANDTVIDFPSPQSDRHNTSMSQGAGYGRRADLTDNQSLSGGIGILLDSAGNDQYTCGVFGQGVGYWQGVGILWDEAGSDRYVGQWYVQGASAHFAIGYLEDSAGNDQYQALMNMAQGAGHDFSVGFLVDRAGNDRYQSPNLSLGAGNANGIGVLLELGGDDTYEAVGVTLGQSTEAQPSTLRGRALTLGVFIDYGGTDTYPTGIGYARNSARVPNVASRGPSMPESQLGVFWDK